MKPTYEINRVSDLLRVPVERRAACLRELEIALALSDLAFDQDDAKPDSFVFRWCDDRDGHCEITDHDGAQIISLEVTYGADKSA